MKAALGSGGKVIHRSESNMLSKPAMEQRLYVVAASECL